MASKVAAIAAASTSAGSPILARNLGAHGPQKRVIAAKDGFGKLNEQRAVRNIPIAAAPRQQVQIVILAFCFAAPTEQDRMGSYSIKTLIEN